MNKIFTQKLIIAIALVCFIFIPSKSYADVVFPPNLPGYYSGGIILLIMIAIIVLVAFCFFIVKEEYKKERIMKVLKKIVIVLEYFLIVWFAYSTAENLIVYANYNGYFGVKRNLVDLIFLFLLTAIAVISMIFLAQKNKRKSIKTVKFGCTIILIVFLWGIIINYGPQKIWDWEFVHYSLPQSVDEVYISLDGLLYEIFN